MKNLTSQTKSDPKPHQSEELSLNSTNANPKNSIQPRSCPLVLVEWEDSRQPAAEWLRISDLGAWSIVQCMSVGWLLHKDKEVVVIAPNMGDINDEDALQASGVMQIAARAVTKITGIIEGEVIFSLVQPSLAISPVHEAVQQRQSS